MASLARRAVLVGVGLIGGSLGMRWKAHGAAERVIGWGRHASSLERAVKLGAIDEYATDLEAAVQGADVVVLCAPVAACLELGPEVARLAPAGCLLTDAGSTKRAIAQVMTEALSHRADGTTFIGGHPMAGSERGGVDAADPYLFENAVWVLCPPPACPPEALGRLRALVAETVAHALLLDAERHDRRVAWISHLPQLAAVALAEAAGDGAASDEGLLGLAGGGFRDTTRIASSPPEMWLDVLATNRDGVLVAIDGLQRRLQQLRAAVDAGDGQAVRGHFTAAAQVRAQVPARRKGLLPAYHDLVLFVPDRPGVIGALCGALGERGINVQDIEILRLREGEGGTLRLGFAAEAEAIAAADALRGLGYPVQRAF